MKQPVVLLILVTFVAAVSFVVASEQFKQGRMSTTTLTGMNEVPNFGDPDGTGIFKFQVNQSQHQFCYELTTENIANAIGLEIRAGERNVVGPTFVTLQAKNAVKDCVSVEAEKIGELMKNPTSYYVSVQTQEFPNGAIRGQLSR